MPKRNPPILAADNVEWTYEALSEELEHLAMLEDLEPPAGPSLSDLPSLGLDDEIARAFEDLEMVAELEAR